MLITRRDTWRWGKLWEARIRKITGIETSNVTVILTHSLCVLNRTTVFPVPPLLFHRYTAGIHCRHMSIWGSCILAYFTFAFTASNTKINILCTSIDECAGLQQTNKGGSTIILAETGGYKKVNIVRYSLCFPPLHYLINFVLLYCLLTLVWNIHSHPHIGTSYSYSVEQFIWESKNKCLSKWKLW